MNLQQIAAAEWSQINTLFSTPAHWNGQNIEPPFLPANLHRRVGRTSTHNNPEFICSPIWISSEAKWRAHIAPKTVSQQELKQAAPIESYGVIFWIVCARFWTWRTPLWDGGGFVLRYSGLMCTVVIWRSFTAAKLASKLAHPSLHFIMTELI